MEGSIAASAQRDVFKHFALTCAGVAVLSYGGQFLGISRYSGSLIGVLILLVGLDRCQRDGRGLAHFGVELGDVFSRQDDRSILGWRSLLVGIRKNLPSFAKESGFAFLVAAITFPPFILAFYFWNAPTEEFAFVMPPNFFEFSAAQLLIAALPEEVFFRGWAQTRLRDRWPADRPLLGAFISPQALILQAALFAPLHLIAIANPARLAVFFPAMLFGWMRAKRGGIGAAIIFHALCNMLSEILYTNWH